MATKTIDGRVSVVRHTSLIVHECGNCGVLFGLEEEYEAKRRKDAKTWYCPNGCSRAWVKSEADTLREQLANERRALSATQDRLNSEQRSHAATKGQLTKVTNRVHAGVCPECNRTFKKLALHMRSKHQGEESARAVAEEMKAR